MKTPKVLLYEAFGKIIYVVAIADGEVQEEEIQKLNELLAGHPWAKEIKWSFSYERNQLSPIDRTIESALDVFEDYGPCAEYASFIALLEEIAKAFGGIVKKEQELIDLLREELLETINGEELAC